MKKTLLTTFVALLCTGAFAQHYSFTTSTNTYTAISGETVVSPDDWDDEFMTVVSPFDFELFGAIVDSLVFDDYAFYAYSQGSEIGEIAGFGVDMVSKGGSSSPISYKVEGNSPDRVLVIQFENATTYNDDDNEDNINFQVRIYETSNVMEFHYGASSVNEDDDPWDGETGAWVGVFDYASEKGIFLTGTPASPTINNVDINDYYDFSLTGHPAKDMVYVWTPRKFPVSAPTVIADNIVSAYPNPFNNTITVSTTATTDFTLTDVQGKIITIFTVNQKYELNTAELTHGVYFLRSSNGDVIKLVK